MEKKFIYVRDTDLNNEINSLQNYLKYDTDVVGLSFNMYSEDGINLIPIPSENFFNFLPVDSRDKSLGVRVAFNNDKWNEFVENVESSGGYINKDIVIPWFGIFNDEKYDVTGIQQDAFFQATNIDSVIIPNTVISIGNNAFKGSSILDIVIPDNVVYMGENVFYESSVIDVVLPSKLDSIKSGVFAKCSRLNTITMPKKIITNISSAAFYDTTGIKFVCVGGSDSDIWLKEFISNNPGKGYINYIEGENLYFDDAGNLVVNINGVEKKFAPITE